MKPILFLLFLSATCYGQQELTVLPIGLIDKNGVMDMNRYAPVSEVNSALQTAQAATTTANNATNRVAALEVKVNSMSGGGTGGELSPKDITASTYTVTQSDANTPLRFLNKCTVTFSSQIKVPFSCRIQMAGGQVTFIGTNIQSKFNYKRIQTTNAWVRVTAVYNGILAIDGDLKQ